MSTGPGALIATYPMHGPSRNQMFASGRDPFLFSVPLLWDKADEFTMLTRHAPSIVTDLGANLAHYRERYLTTLANPRAIGDDLRDLDNEDEREFRTFYGRFYDLVARELKATDSRVMEYGRLAS